MKAPKTPFEIAAMLRDKARSAGGRDYGTEASVRRAGRYQAPRGAKGTLVTTPARYDQSMIAGMQPATRQGPPSGPSIGPFAYRGWSYGVDND